MRVILTDSTGADRDATELLTMTQLSGAINQCSRQLDLTLAVSDTDGNLPRISTGLFRSVGLYRDSGARLFSGSIVQRQRQTGSSTMSLTALDRGMYLAGNQGWYSFTCTPEAAARQVCAAFGIPVGTLARTGVTVKRKFDCVELHKIIMTMYSKASETTGKKYYIKFDGNSLSVLERPSTAAFVLDPSRNLISADYTEDGQDYRNSVAIYSKTGALIRTIGTKTPDALAGLLQAAVTQQDGEDASKEARSLLEDHDIQQNVTVECFGDPSLLSGGGVTILDNSSGAAGLFWIDSDKHVWKNGVYTTSLTLNFRQIMDTQSAGTEVK